MRALSSQTVLEDSHQAHRLQSLLLPKRGLCFAGWETYFEYTPAGVVGGDYCDLVPVEDELFFLIGDAVGKGFSGSIIVAQLHALVHALLPLKLPLNKLFERINRIFCETSIVDYNATLICGRASSVGAIEIVNAGHPPLLLLRCGRGMPFAATGLPVGYFWASSYEITELQLLPGETLLFYTDGITEARDPFNNEYSGERLASLAAARSDLRTDQLVKACINDVTLFTCGVEPSDDRTVMALRYGKPATNPVPASESSVEPSISALKIDVSGEQCELPKASSLVASALSQFGQTTRHLA